MEKIKKYKILLVMFILLFLAFSFSIIKLNIFNKKNNIIETNAQISDKKINWGIKRGKNHIQPDLGKVNIELIEKYKGIAIGNKENKDIYLTFDEGYEAGYTESILKTLKENNVKATFFITAHYLNTQEELVKRMIEDGHIVGNHTVNHYSMPSLNNEKLKDEIMKLHTSILDKMEYEMKYLRPPKGEYSERTLNFTKSLGYTTVMWSLAYEDWDEKHQKGDEYAKNKILDNLHPGAVILLHGNSKDNTNVLGTVIKEARNIGYEFKSLDEFQK